LSKVCVVGGGIIGIASAAAIQEKLLGSCQVTIISEDFCTNTNSFGAGREVMSFMAYDCSRPS
jgi:glycine/D-amino acid oxidase-like deaminating enzyme